MPREPQDAPEDLLKQALCQVAFGQLKDEVPGMPDEAPAGLEEPRLEARQGPALDGERQDKPAQERAENISAELGLSALDLARRRRDWAPPRGEQGG